MKKVIGIRCKDKFYVTIDTGSSYGRYSSLQKYLINGKTPTPTFHDNWVMIDEEPKQIQEYKSQPDINHRYELIDPSMQSEKMPLVFNREDVAYYNEENYGWIWKSEFSMYQSLYNLISDPQPDILVDVEFEYKTLMEVTEIKEYEGFAYDVQRTRYKSDGTIPLIEKDVHYQLLDTIIFPEIVLPMRPCSLTSKQSYDLVRQYVKQHINYEVATITSDYDFCFTVKKKIPLSEPETYTVDVNNSWFNKRKKRPKYETRYKAFREIECFEMTYEEKRYQGYTPIQGFRGENQEDLKNNIDDYCKKLIEFINEPVSDCPKCKGRGVIFNEKLEIKKEGVK